jgi:hypothetical protein
MDHPALPARKAPEAREVEVERVEEARACVSRDAIVLDCETAALQLSHERAKKLVSTTGRRRLEVVEHRDVGRPPP